MKVKKGDGAEDARVKNHKLEKALEEIKQKNLELQRINAEKDKFFSIIAHDLKGPFNGFLGLTEHMMEEVHNMSLSEIQKIVTVMRNSATNLYQLLENLLDWSRLKNGLIDFKPDNFLLLSRVNESIGMINTMADKKWIEIEIEIDPDLRVIFDQNMFRSILQNLVTNAVKFTEKRGMVTLRAGIFDENFICFSVIDTGIGMNLSRMENLFKLDVDTRRPGTESEPSTGLGLILCKDFIENHGCKLWAESSEGVGSKFHFTLPIGK